MIAGKHICMEKVDNKVQLKALLTTATLLKFSMSAKLYSSLSLITLSNPPKQIAEKQNYLETHLSDCNKLSSAAESRIRSNETNMDCTKASVCMFKSHRNLKVK